MPLAETQWTLDTPDGHRIYGVTNRNTDQQNRAALFLVHSLTGHKGEYLQKQAADFFAHKYDVYRFDLYSWLKNARTLHECTLQTHASDLNQVINHFAHSYDKIFVAGHSYGGPTIMMASPTRTTAASLWDPAFDLTIIYEDFCGPYLQEFNARVMKGSVACLIGEDMVQEAKRYDQAACLKLAENFGAPVQVINAAGGVYVNNSFSYHSAGNPLNTREIVEETAHCFDESNTCDILLQKVEAWFQKFE